jgi:hypothetical protein
MQQNGSGDEQVDAAKKLAKAAASDRLSCALAGALSAVSCKSPCHKFASFLDLLQLIVKYFFPLLLFKHFLPM